MKYSPSTGFFYNPEWVYKEIPGDLIEVAQNEYAELQAKRADGFVIKPGRGGRPMAAFDEQAFKVTRESVEMARLRAYADPVTGSDRYRAEAEAERLQGNEEAAKEAEQKMLSRRTEIQTANPWPKEDQ